MHSKQNKIVIIFTSLLLGGIVVSIASHLTTHANVDLTEPRAETYVSDELFFLKTFYLLKQKADFYDAFPTAFNQKSSRPQLGNDTFTWRFPTVFYMWKWTAQNGREILRIFWMMAGVTLVFIFLILKKFLKIFLALAGTLFFLPYFAGISNYPTSFLFTEWWALFFYLIGMSLFLYKKLTPAWLMFVLAIITRELFFIPLITLCTFFFFQKKYRFFFSSILVVFLLFFSFHYSRVQSQFPENSIAKSTPFLSHIHGFDKYTFQRMMAFSMQKYPLIQYRIQYLFLVITIVGFIANLITKQKNHDKNVLYISTMSFVIVLPFISSSIYNDYWGILIMLQLILSALISLPAIMNVFRNLLNRIIRIGNFQKVKEMLVG